jgi:hypothetical protein
VIVTLTNSFVPKQDFYVQVDEDGKPRNLLNEKSEVEHVLRVMLMKNVKR